VVVIEITDDVLSEDSKYSLIAVEDGVQDGVQSQRVEREG